MTHAPISLDSLLRLSILIGLLLLASSGRPRALSGSEGDDPPGTDAAFDRAARTAAETLLSRHGDQEAERIHRGVGQVRRLWRAGDGDADKLLAFLEEEFIPQGPLLDATFDRLEFILERIDGYMTSLERDLRRGVDLDIGPILPLDHVLGAYSPSAHVSEDLFSNRVAFTVLLNFPLTTLPQRLEHGKGWTRRQWAETRLAQRFNARVPAEISQSITAAFSLADTYISTYNIYMHHLLDEAGERLFPANLRLITHWGLRDELKARYADPDGLPRQRMIQQVMERIVRQEIPAAVVDNPLLDWNPYTNEVKASGVRDAEPSGNKTSKPRGDREQDERYRQWIGVFRAMREADPYFPDAPTFIDRRFNVNREIPEEDVARLFETVLSSPLGTEVAAIVQRRLGRPLEPFDIWYAGFKPRGKYTEAELDAITRRRYPTPAAYSADIPRMLLDLGFSEAQAGFLADMIEVDPSRGAGHAMGAARRDDKAHLRTRVGKDGMDYKGYNIAVHEMGHNVEQVFSMTKIDHTLLQGVPNTAFTEALAFVFQGRDLELLGLSGPDEEAEKMAALENFWATREIAGVAMVDMTAWRWLYANPEATPEQFRKAVVGIARDIWNEYYAGIFGRRDVPLLAIYSHMIDGGMYTPDYPLGHLIAFQIEEHFKKASPFGEEFERICRLGALTPDAWMKQAVAGPLSARPLLEATRQALE